MDAAHGRHPCYEKRQPNSVSSTCTMPRMTTPLVDMEAVSVWLPNKTHIIRNIDWTVCPGDHWVLLGPNGSGKSTLLTLAAAERHPSSGQVTVLGERLGQTSLWDLRERIGTVEPNQKILDWLPAEEVVLTGKTGTVWPLNDRLTDADRARAVELLDLVGCANLVGREITTCSQGERQRVRIARALMADPPLLLLDEPATGLDLPAREALLAALAAMAQERPAMATVLVSHHLEEIPPTTTHAFLLRDGQCVAQGRAVLTLTTELVSDCFGFPVTVSYDDRRWSARAVADWQTRRAVFDATPIIYDEDAEI
jgi:iron complex transport system ATP-binding protein